MRRILSVTLLFAMILVPAHSATADAGAKRTVEGRYDTPFVPFTGGCPQSGGCVSIPTKGTESKFTAKVTDVHGLPVFVQVTASTNADGTEPVLFTFCGETTKPVGFPPGSELHFWVGYHPLSGSSYDSCPSAGGGLIVTTGTVSVTLSGKPATRTSRPSPRN